MFGPTTVLKRIYGKPFADALRGLLQLRLEVLAPYLRSTLRPEIGIQPLHHRARLLNPAVHKYAAENSLHRVRKQGIALAPSLILLAAGKAQAAVKMQLARNGRQRSLIDEAGTQARQLAFPCIGEPGEKLRGNGNLQHGVAEELQTLIVRVARRMLVGPRTVRHREQQQRFILETVPYPVLQHIQRHGMTLFRFTSLS